MSLSKRAHDPSSRALALARQYLRFGTRSTEQLRTYLRTRQVPEQRIQSIVADCTRLGLLDDRACATLWANTLAERGYAWVAIRQQLRANGLDAQLIEQVLSPLQACADDAQRARLLVHARSRRGAGTDRRHRNRLARLLSQRGFDADLIEQILVESFGLPSEP